MFVLFHSLDRFVLRYTINSARIHGNNEVEVSTFYMDREREYIEILLFWCNRANHVPCLSLYNTYTVYTYPENNYKNFGSI